MLELRRMALTNIQNPTDMDSLDFHKSSAVPLSLWHEVPVEFSKGIPFQVIYRKV